MNFLPKKLSIRSKITLVILASVVVLFGVIYFVSETIISKSYLSIEENNTVQNTERVSDSLSNTVSQLTLKLVDWASWDDSYKFVQDKNQVYIDSNLQDGSWTSLKINLMTFVNLKGEIVFSSMFDLSSNKKVSDKSFEDYITSHPKVITHNSLDSTYSGIVMLPEGPIMISSKPILTSKLEGPVMGTLIFGKFLDKSVIDSLSELTSLPIEIYDLNGAMLPTDVLTAKTNLIQGKKYFTTPLSYNLVAGYEIINDIEGNPALIAKISTPRQMYIQSQNSMYVFIVTTTICIILVGIFLILLLQKIVITRLLKIGKEVEKISTTNDLSSRLDNENIDEIGRLVFAINNMLEIIESSKKIEKDAVAKMKEAEIALGAHTADVEKLNQLMLGRELKMVELKKEVEELKIKLGEKT